jgi:O-antigen/teichoic acid export membrane protein
MSFRLSLSPTAWITADRVTQQVLWLILFSILAPILGPRPYGLFAIVMVFVGFCEFILIEGVVEALVSVDELDHLHTSTANMAYGGIALVLGLAISILAPAIGAVFHDDELAYLIWTLAPLPVLAALSAAPVAVLRRTLRYKQLALRSIGGLALGGLFGIALAVAGAGVWALVLQVLTQRIAEFIIVWLSASLRLRFKWSTIHFREINSVGMNVFAARTMSFVCGQAPRIFIGYMLGPTEVGLFSLSNRVLDTIIHTTVSTRTAVGRIEMRDAERGSAEFDCLFLSMIQNTSIVSFPLLLGVAALTPDLFRIWLDERWTLAVIPTQFLLFSGLPLVIFYCIDAGLLAAKLSNIFNKFSAVQGITTIATVLCAMPFGLDVTCFSFAARAWILCPILLIWFARECHISVYPSLRQALRFFVGAMIMASVMYGSLWWLHRSYDFFFLCIEGGMLYFGYLYCFARRQFREFLADTIFYRYERQSR